MTTFAKLTARLSLFFILLITLVLMVALVYGQTPQPETVKTHMEIDYTVPITWVVGIVGTALVLTYRVVADWLAMKQHTVNFENFKREQKEKDEEQSKAIAELQKLHHADNERHLKLEAKIDTEFVYIKTKLEENASTNKRIEQQTAQLFDLVKSTITK